MKISERCRKVNELALTHQNYAQEHTEYAGRWKNRRILKTICAIQNYTSKPDA